MNTQPETKPEPMRDLSYISDCIGNVGDWKGRHLKAVRAALSPLQGQYPVILGIGAWVAYAKAHQARYESTIGEDYFLGPAWRDWGKALRTLLNGELGAGIDAGTLDAILVHNMALMGYEGDF